MGEKGRFRDGRKRDFSRKRGDFEQDDDRRQRDTDDRESYERPAPDFADDPELAAVYRNLRARHKSFEGARAARERKEWSKERGSDRPRRNADRRDERGGSDRFSRDRRFGNSPRRGDDGSDRRGRDDFRGHRGDDRGNRRGFRDRRDD